MKIYEAAEVVLRDAGKPMRAKDIYSEIARRGLFEFRAKDAAAVVAKALRTKSKPRGDGSGPIIFSHRGSNVYGLAVWGESSGSGA